MKDKPAVVDYLAPEDDGLPMRESGDYAKDKLRILEGYISRFITSMRTRPWRAFYYVDLQAGPGKNVFSPSGEIMLGSPLIALTMRYAFTHYRFVELNPQNCAALQRRVDASDRKNDVEILQGDCNFLVDEIVNEIQSIDRPPYRKDFWHSLNLAFLDPEGLELHWSTVEKLGRLNKMDLIINFSTSGITRNARQMLKKGNTDVIDRYFGTAEWQDVYKNVANQGGSHVRRALLNFYKDRLQTLGYVTIESGETPDEQVFRNRRNVQIYTLMAASKDELGVKFWQDTIKGNPMQPRLL